MTLSDILYGQVVGFFLPGAHFETFSVVDILQRSVNRRFKKANPHVDVTSLGRGFFVAVFQLISPSATRSA